MNKRRVSTIGLAVALVLALAGGIAVVSGSFDKLVKTRVTAYFDNTNGMFVGDEVRILGVPVGRIESIEPQPDQAKVTFWFDRKYKVPADAKAAVLSQQLVTARAIQLVPAYAGGPALADGAVIPRDRTIVPIEWDDLRDQLQKLTDALQPTQPGGQSPLGQFVTTAADNLRGNGASIRDAVIKMSEAFSALGDHSNDIFSTIENLSILVSGLQSSTGLMKQLNQDLAAVTGLLANDQNEVGRAVTDVGQLAEEMKSFAPDVAESLGTTVDKLSSVSQAVADSLDDIKQTLHVAPTAFQNLINIYQPAQAALTGALVVNNFANPITFLCGAIQAASRLNAEQSAKLCVQYLAPIIKNRQYNFPPIGLNPFVGASARPNEVTYSEDWMRPDYVPPQPPPAAEAPPAADAGPPLPAEATDPPPAETTDPAGGLPGMMVPQGGGR
jgi:phospholipid/cholesterol/gamma-HCH transport system substrate-binding protein